MRIVIFGPPGGGKGTYSDRISERYNIPHISTGDIMREEMDRKTELGERVRGFVKRGGLVPDSVVNEIVRERLSKPDCGRGFILDGYPRTLAQAEALDRMTRVDAVVNIQVPEPLVVRRLSTRRICRGCGAIYNLITLPPKVSGRCDSCGGELYQREDDFPEVINKRLEEYRVKTGPLLRHYRDRDLVRNVRIEKEGEVDAAIRLILDALEKGDRNP